MRDINNNGQINSLNIYEHSPNQTTQHEPRCPHCGSVNVCKASAAYKQGTLRVADSNGNTATFQTHLAKSAACDTRPLALMIFLVGSAILAGMWISSCFELTHPIFFVPGIFLGFVTYFLCKPLRQEQAFNNALYRREWICMACETRWRI